VTNGKKKELALKLYTTSFFATQKELAEYLETSEQTICKWVKVGKWDDLKESYLATNTQELAFLYKQLRLMRENLEKEGRDTYNNKEMDVITKITAAIKSLKSEIGVEDVIDVCMKVVEWLRTRDLKAAQEASAIFNEYIKAHV